MSAYVSDCLCVTGSGRVCGGESLGGSQRSPLLRKGKPTLRDKWGRRGRGEGHVHAEGRL